MSGKRRLVVALALGALGTATAQAQGRYLVLVGMAGSTKASVVEFRPCVPAETSDCGAWLDRVIDTSVDSSYGKRPTVLRQSVLSDGAASVAIDNGRVSITSLAGPTSGRPIVATGVHGVARALATGGDPQTVFVVSSGATHGEPGEVCLIDLRFGGVVARFRLDATPESVAMARR